MVGVGKAATWPAQQGDTHLFQGLHYVRTHSVDIGNIRAVPHINASVDAPAQMFREVSVDILIDGSFGAVCVDNCLCHSISLPYSFDLLTCPDQKPIFPCMNGDTPPNLERHPIRLLKPLSGDPYHT